MSTESRFLRCPRCRRNRPAVWIPSAAAKPVPGAPVCPAFVRAHWHIEGVCRRWLGLRPEDPLACEDCARPLVPFIVAGRTTGTECGGVCRSARGPACDCSCGGANHGTG